MRADAPGASGSRTGHHRAAAARDARLGIAKSYQITTIFPHLTRARERPRGRAGPARRLRLLAARRTAARACARGRRMLATVGLAAKATSSPPPARHGEKRHLEIAIALAAEPVLLLLDEPTAGMSPEETDETMRADPRAGGGRTIMLVEHKMKVVMKISDRITVLHQGAGARRGHARGDPRQRRACSRPTSARRDTTPRPPPARRRGRPHATTARRTSSRAFALRRRGRGGDAHRPQRRGQDDHAALDHGHRARRAAGASASAARTSRGCRRTRSRGGASRGCRRSAAMLPEPHRAREPAPGHAGRGRGGDAGDAARRGVRLLSAPARARSTSAGRFLSGGEQQMLAIARGLVARPTLMLVDEPTEGLAPMLVRTLTAILAEINRRGKHDLARGAEPRSRARRCRSRLYVIDQGRIQFEGTPDELRARARDPAAVLWAC